LPSVQSGTRLQPRRRLNQLHAVLPHFVGYSGKHCVGVLFLQAQQQRHPAKVWPYIEQVLRCNLPRHNAFPDPALGKRADHLRKLANPNPFYIVHQ
jgi:hypothetical protein